MKKIEVIGMPMKYGCMVDGADLSYSVLKNSLESVFDTKCDNVIDIPYDDMVEHRNDKKLRYVEQVMDISNKLYSDVYKTLENDKFPLIIGGDHSTCIGSISASLDYTKGDLSVIYIDKHADIHTDKTSPSGNLHGIPLSVCIGRCDERFNIGEFKLKPENLYYIGLSNFEIEEIKEGLKKVVAYRSKKIENPYYKEGTCDAILKVIKSYPLDTIIQKQFYDIK